MGICSKGTNSTLYSGDSYLAIKKSVQYMKYMNEHEWQHDSTWDEHESKKTGVTIKSPLPVSTSMKTRLLKDNL